MKTRDLVEFNDRGLEQVKQIAAILIRDGYPDDFYKDDVIFEFDTQTGITYLTNDYNQICMLDGCYLEVVYELSNTNESGFLADLVCKVDDNIITDREDINYIKDICESRYADEGVTICTKKLKYQKITHELYRTLIFGYDDIDEVMRKHDFILVDESEGEYHDLVYQYDYDDDIEFMISVRTDGSYDIVSIIDAVV